MPSYSRLAKCSSGLARAGGRAAEKKRPALRRGPVVNSGCWISASALVREILDIRGRDPVRVDGDLEVKPQGEVLRARLALKQLILVEIEDEGQRTVDRVRLKRSGAAVVIHARG